MELNVGNTERKRVLVTGAYGLIGNSVYAHLANQPERYEPFGMVRRARPSTRIEGGDFLPIPPEHLAVVDLGDLDGLCRAAAGIDVIVHMAADPDGRAGWQSVLASNIIGAHNLFEAARAAGVKRVIYASTNQVVFGYRAEEPYRALLEGGGPADRRAAPIRHDQPTRPLNDYACSKVYGEALAHMYAQVHGMSCIALRIGWVTADDSVPNRALWCSRRDIVQLVERCIEAPLTLRFDVFFGHSNNQHNLVDIAHAREVVGYSPLDSAEEHLQGAK